MKIISKTSSPGGRILYIAETGNKNLIEFEERKNLAKNQNTSWIVNLSASYGCPVQCSFCKSGKFHMGNLSFDDILEQIDYLFVQHFPNRITSIPLKLGFSRMGDPSYNNDVIEFLKKFPSYYWAEDFQPIISTIGPEENIKFFENLLALKKDMYRTNFALSFTIYSTNNYQRKKINPAKAWNMAGISKYGNRFYDEGGKKINLVFVVSGQIELNKKVIYEYFKPEVFSINLISQAGFNGQPYALGLEQQYMKSLRSLGYDVSINGDSDFPHIGQDSGANLLNYLKSNFAIEESYTQNIEKCPD